MTTQEERAGQVWQAMRTIVLTNERRQQACEAVDLSFTQLRTLLQASAGPGSQRDLVAAMGSDAAYMTLVLDELEKRGFVQRCPDPDDRRRKLVSLTGPGEEAATRAKSILRAPPDGLACLSRAELDAVHAALIPVAEAIDSAAGLPAWR